MRGRRGGGGEKPKPLLGGALAVLGVLVDGDSRGSRAARDAAVIGGVNSGGLFVVDHTHMVVITPSGASTGLITVTTPAGVVSSVDNFIVLP